MRRHSSNLEALRRFFRIEEQPAEKMACRFVDAVQPTFPAILGAYDLPLARSIISVPDPAAAAQWLHTATVATYIESIRFSFVTSAVVATRSTAIQHISAAGEILWRSFSLAQVASVTRSFYYQKHTDAVGEDGVQGHFVAWLPVRLYLAPSESIGSNTSSIAAGDQFSIIRILAFRADPGPVE